MPTTSESVRPSSDDQQDWRDALKPPPDDRLGVLTGTAIPLREASMVSLDLVAVETLASQWAATDWPESTATLADLHAPGAAERIPNFTLALDALNFCFWGEPGQPRWQVTWHGETHDGYNALAAALSRAVEEGYPIWDADWLADLDAADLATVLRPDSGTPVIPLFAERLANAREVGRVLRARYEGQFANVVEEAGGDAVALALALERDFSSFADVADWRGRPVPFLKRAQICVADLRALTVGEGVGDLRSMNRLTAFADYKLPQLLRRLEVISYAPALADTVDNYTHIPAGSEPEIEIRAATIWAVEFLARALAQRGQARTAAEIDYRLWSESQDKQPNERPYHRTRTIYY